MIDYSIYSYIAESKMAEDLLSISRDDFRSFIREHNTGILNFSKQL